MDRVDKITVRVVDELHDQVTPMFFEDANRILTRVIARTTENLANGKRQRTRPLEVELKVAQAVAFDRACYFNKAAKLIFVNHYLWQELERLE